MKSVRDLERAVVPSSDADLAAAIARDLFSSGCGKHADHLEQRLDGKYLSGWCESAVRQRVLAHLLARAAARKGRR